jgi:peptide/nickel transport system substrate-binding protein
MRTPAVCFVLSLGLMLSLVSPTLPAAPRQIVVADTAELTSGDPRIAGFQTDYDTIFQMCDALVTFDRNSRVVPSLASSWRVINPTTYEFTLRSGAKFQDGMPVTAADVKQTMDRILDPAFKSTTIAPDFEPFIKSTDVITPTVVRFNLKIPYPAFLNRMVYIFPVSHTAVERLGDKEFSRHPICAGPFRLAEWMPDDHKALDAVADYWGGRPSVDRIIIKPVPQGATRVAGLRAGEVDLAVGVPPDQLEAVTRSPGLTVITNPSGRRMLFFMDALSKPFDDRRVRQAVNYAIDWTAICKTIMGGLAQPLPGIAAPGVFGYTPVQGYEYNPAKAKQLLAEAGYSTGFDLAVEGPNGHYFQDRDTVQVVTGYLRAVGINATPQIYEWGQYAARRRNRQFKMGLWASLPLYRDMDDLGFNLEAKRASTMYDNPAVARLFEAGRAEYDPQKRKAIYAKLTDLLELDAPIVFGPEITQAYGVTRRLKWRPRPGTDILFGLRDADL